MNALEKVAWTEFLVSIFTITLVTVLIPLYGSKAHAGFGFLGFLVCGFWFLRQRSQKLIIDERDREIEKRATQLGIGIAWQTMYLTLICFIFWAAYFNDKVVPSLFLIWLIWIQFTLCYGIKGLVGIIMYRRQMRAS